jgi:hypothetical protein
MSIESVGGGQGEKPDDPKPPNHNQSSRNNPDKKGEVGPFKLYKDARSPTNWGLRADVDGHTIFMNYHPGIHRLTREEFIERIRDRTREIDRWVERNVKPKKPDQDSESDQ